MYERDTIAAIATPLGEGAVAVIRMSGVDAEKIARAIFLRKGKTVDRLTSHRLYHGAIHDPRTERMVDEVLLTIMRAPHSYTGEDVVEVQCHGGAFLTRQLLGLILAQGARQAEAGEFTKRAFLNGKLDLAQAEAVLDLIRARTAKGAEIALSQARGSLSNYVDALRQELLDIMVQVEAAIDFPDEDIELLQKPKLIDKIRFLADKLSAIAETYNWGRLFREGARVCICGRPNVGKSSLLNALLGENRVIVTPVPGTTRDVIEESVNLDGLPLVLWDTAGIREASDEVEKLGVELSRQHLEKADAAMLVVDGSVHASEEDKGLLGGLVEKRKIIVINKSDLPRVLSLDEFGKSAESFNCVAVSAKTGTGIEQLKNRLRELLLEYQTESNVVVSNVRHHSSLVRSAAGLRSAADTLALGLAPELAAVNLHEARDGLEEIIGLVDNDTILERIFSEFCIGK